MFNWCFSFEIIMKEKLYRISPVWIKTILLNIKAYSNKKQRYSKNYHKYLVEYSTLWNSSREEVLNYQKEQLSLLLKECYDNVSFYREKFDALNINKEQIEKNPIEVLKFFPILTKEDRKTKVEILINNNRLRPSVEIGYTSGTSGTPTVNYLDKESIERSFALWTRFHDTIGVGSNKNVRKVRFSGRLVVKPTANKPPYWIYNKFDNQLFMSTYHLTDSNLKHYIDKLNKFKPDLLDGYPSALYVLSKFINNNKLVLEFKPKAIATTAETLYDYQRLEIEKAFTCKVFNQYASSEGVPPITECRNGRLHIHEDTGYFEFLNNENLPTKPGEIAKVVVTSFRNWKTPLVRYDIQDSVLLPLIQEKCECGCNMKYVDSIIGREDDILWTEEKGYVGRMDTAYKGLEGIKKSQLIQISKNQLIVNQSVDKEYTEAMNRLFIQNLKDRLGESIDIKINILEDVPNGANGKFDAVIRKFEIDL